LFITFPIYLFIHRTQSSSAEVGSELPDVNYCKSISWWCFSFSAAQAWMAAILVTCSFACCSIHLRFKNQTLPNSN